MAHVLHVHLLLHLVINKLRLLLGLVLHRNLGCETLRHLWHCCSSLLLNELEEGPESVFILEKILDCVLVLSNER